MDEVFLLGENDCERCRGKNKAELFAGEVTALHDHLAQSGRTLWIWGDRFLDGTTTGIGKWEASIHGTQGAIGMVPTDVVICDWHYERVLPSITYFAMEGFPVVACPWRKPNVALGQLAIQVSTAPQPPRPGTVRDISLRCARTRPADPSAPRPACRRPPWVPIREQRAKSAPVPS